MKSRIQHAAVALLMLFHVGCLGGQTGSAPGGTPTAVGPGAASPGDVSGSGLPAGGGGGDLPGDGSGGDGGSFYYIAGYDETASTAKPLPGGALGPSGIWEGGNESELAAKGAISQCSTIEYLANGTSQTVVNNRLQGQVISLTTVGDTTEQGPVPNGCSTGDYLSVVEGGGETLIGCTYFPLTTDCRFYGYLPFVDSADLKYYVYHSNFTRYPSCDPVPLVELGLELAMYDSFFVAAKDLIVNPRTSGTPPECPVR